MVTTLGRHPARLTAALAVVLLGAADAPADIILGGTGLLDGRPVTA